MITPKKDLRGGHSLWADSSRINVRHRSQLQYESCDIAIVGGGVSGALIALTLSAEGHDVVVVDRRSFLRGSTLASTAMIQFELDTPMTQLAEKLGAKSAERVYRRSFLAVSDLRELIARHGLSCAWKNRDALYLAGNETGRRGLEAEAKYRAKINLPSEFLDQRKLAERFAIARTGAILSSGAAELNPAQLTAECLRAASKHGARLYTPHEISGFVANRSRVQLQTRKGSTISARRVIFATGYEVVQGIPKSDYEITSSWAIATKPLPQHAFWPTKCLIWEAADPYLYLRSTSDNRIVAGGEDSKLTNPEQRDRAIPEKAKRLLNKLSKLLPGRNLEIDYAWAGAFADNPTGLPHIAPVQDTAGSCLAVLGCGGNGKHSRYPAHRRHRAARLE